MRKQVLNFSEKKLNNIINWIDKNYKTEIIKINKKNYKTEKSIKEMSIIKPELLKEPYNL